MPRFGRPNMGHRGTGQYPPDWPTIAQSVKKRADWRCAMCQYSHAPALGYRLEVHHLDRDKCNSEWWNLIALCQRCHPSVGATFDLLEVCLLFRTQLRLWETSADDYPDWLKPHVVGFLDAVRAGWRPHNHFYQPELPGMQRYLPFSYRTQREQS